MRAVAAAVALFVLLAGSGPLAALTDTPENRERLATELQALQRGDVERSIGAMIDGLEKTLPEAQQREFRQLMGQVLDIEALLRFSVLTMAKHFTTDELEALLAFYRTPLARSAMAKMPLVMQDTIPFSQAMILESIKRLPRDLRPPAMRDL